MPENMAEYEKYLSEYGFEPWQCGGMQGWYRHTDFIKDCIAGEIARYSADDYIVAVHQGKESENWLKNNWQAKEDVIKHRFLLLDSKLSELCVKSYWFGIRGWLEVLHYRKGDQNKRFTDLIYLAEQLEARK